MTWLVREHEKGSKLQTFFILGICLALFAYGVDLHAANQSEQNVLDTFLKSKVSSEKRNAFLEIVNHCDSYKNAVLQALGLFENNAVHIQNSLIYIAAYIRDERYIPFLIGLIENKEYSYESCVYSCPVVFSLAIYSCFSPYRLPELNRELTPIADLLSTIQIIDKIELIDEKVSDHVQGPGIDPYLAEYKKLTTDELLKLAGMGNGAWVSRYAAAVILQCRMLDEKYLPELYWLAITEPEDAVSWEFRYSVYDAIYKTEKASLEKAKSNTIGFAFK